MQMRCELVQVFGAVKNRQRGAALIIVLMLMLIGLGATVYAFVQPASRTIASDKVTAAALARAKDALIGYSASYPDQPGVLPCPDNNNNGTADSPCGAAAATAIGRLPWKTLGLPDIRDGSGECLWYAVSANFKKSSTGPTSVNSDTPGTLTVNDATGTALPSPPNPVIAIVFAPGPVLSGKNRTASGSAICGGLTGPGAAAADAPAYLDTAASINNATGNGAANKFVVAARSDTFNDQVLAITSDALFAVANVRVAKEVRAALDSYRSTNHYYPAANPYSSGGTAYYCDPATYQGRIPITIKSLPLTGCILQADWAGELPAWFATNNWNLVTHYAVSGACTVVAGLALCDSIGGDIAGVLGLGPLGPPLTVTGITTNARMLLIVTGRALGSQTHSNSTPCASAAECLENVANTDGDNIYVKPSPFPASNDRMAITCGTVSTCVAVP